MESVSGLMAMSWLRVCTATHIRPVTESYCVFPASPPRGIGRRALKRGTFITSSCCPYSSDTKSLLAGGAPGKSIGKPTPLPPRQKPARRGCRAPRPLDLR